MISVAKVKKKGKMAERRAVKDLQRLASEISWENYKKNLYKEFDRCEERAKNIVGKLNLDF